MQISLFYIHTGGQKFEIIKAFYLFIYLKEDWIYLIKNTVKQYYYEILHLK